MVDANREMGNEFTVSEQENGNPMNLLLRFGVEKNEEMVDSDQSEKPELNLTLSLGGVFSGNSDVESLTRSSSVTDGELNVAPVSPKIPLDRSTSEPENAESDPRFMTVKEIQTLRRLEAKRRLVEQRNARAAAAAAAGEEKHLGMGMPPPPPQPLVSAPPSGSMVSFVKVENVELPSRNIPLGGQGQKLGETSTEVNNAGEKEGNPFKKAKIYNLEIEEAGMNLLKQMPSVSTIGEGPEGKKIEGFLYKYKTEVSIVCICHGIYLSPTEFVKHAGGNEVSNPMKLIKVFPNYL